MGGMLRAKVSAVKKRPGYLRRDAQRPAAGLVDDRPVGPRADARLAVLADEFHVAVELGSPGLAGPGAGGDCLALQHGAEIVDLVADDDPDIIVLMGGVGDGPPVRGRDLL